MAEIRLSKLTKQFNIGLSTLVDFLRDKGVEVEMNPNAKISDEFLPAITSKFGEEQKLKQDSEKVAIKLKEIIELGTKKKNTGEEDEEDEPVQEIIIKSNSIIPETSVEKQAAVPEEKQEKTPEQIQEPVKAAPKIELAAPKVVDRIDLSKFETKASKKEEKTSIHCRFSYA